MTRSLVKGVAVADNKTIHKISVDEDATTGIAGVVVAVGGISNEPIEHKVVAKR